MAVVLITGCSSGLGRALALRLHDERDAAGGRSYQVWASARRLESLSELEAAGVHTVQLDVTKQKSGEAAVERVLREAGRINVLVNNAGLSRVGPVVEQPLEEIQEVFDTNFLGVVRVTQAVAPHMMRQRSGLIVQVGSVVSFLASPFGGAYTASKAALLGLTDSLRLELQPFGVRVAHVTLGATRSNFAENILSGASLARYDRQDSLYRPWAELIKARANASQDPASSMPAEEAADQVAAVINAAVLGASPSLWSLAGVLHRLRSALGGGRQVAPAEQQQGQQAVAAVRVPPTWFLAGGGARLFFLSGLAQKLVGWPINGILAKKFKLDASL